MARKKLQGFENIKHWLCKELDKIQKSEMTIRRKNNAAKKAADKARKALWIKTAERRPIEAQDKYHVPESEEVTAVTHNRYVTRLRRDLEELGYLSFTFLDDVNSVILKHGKRAKELSKIDTSTYKKAKYQIDNLIKKTFISEKKSKLKPTLNAIKSYREDLQKLAPRNPCMLSLVRSSSEKLNMNRRMGDRREKYQRKPKVINAIETINIIYALFKKGTWQDLAVGVSLATGRRCVEVVHYGNFEKVENFKLKFSGQRKTKMNANKEYNIPSLVEADLVIKAIDELRKSERITSLIGRLNGGELHEAEFARRINGSVAASLNDCIRDTFDPEKNPLSTAKIEHKRLKDSRAIYARISYSIYTANSKKAGRIPVQDSIFFKENLGHTDPNECESYKQFIISDEEHLSAYQIKKAKKDGSQVTFADRLPLMKSLSETEIIQTKRAFLKYIEWAIEKLNQDPDFVFDNMAIRSDLGGKAATIGEFVKLLKEMKLDKPNLIPVKVIDKKKKKKPETKTFTKQIEVTLSYTVEIEYTIDYDEDGNAIEDEWDVKNDAIHDAVSDLDIDDYDAIDWG